LFGVTIGSAGNADVAILSAIAMEEPRSPVLSTPPQNYSDVTLPTL
jgi:hypothetical protein